MPDTKQDSAVQEVTHTSASLAAAAPELLETCKELTAALAALMRAVSTYAGSPAIDVIEVWVEELQALGINDGLGVRSRHVIAKAEGRSL